MKYLAIAVSLLALSACSYEERWIGVIDSVETTGSGTSQVCTVRFRFLPGAIIFVDRAMPNEPGLKFLRCKALKANDRIYIINNKDDTSIDWNRL